jgi:hypothetical protein
MIKKFIFSIAFLCLAQVNAQKITKDPGDFSSVKVYDRIQVVLVASTENKVEISGTRADEVQVVNNNGELKIKMNLKKLLKGEEIEAVVYFKKLTGVDANEGSSITSQETLKAIGFSISAKEGAEIKLKLEAEKTNINISSGGMVDLKGSTNNQDIVMKAGGTLDADKFISKQTTISVNAGGDANIYATDFVDAKVRAGGSVMIYGKPKEINQKAVLGGTIKEAK